MYPFPTDLVKIGSIAGRQTKINLKKTDGTDLNSDKRKKKSKVILLPCLLDPLTLLESVLSRF